MSLRALLWIAVSTQSQADEDKNSLQTQERDARAVAIDNGWDIIDVLKVPGHSRNYIDIYECARDMRESGIDAFDKLIQHWDAKDFDILVVRDSSRFARTQSLNAYVVEKTIDINAKIYSLADTWVDRNNYRMWISMSGFSAATEIDNLKKRREIGFEGRAKRNLPVNKSTTIAHKIIRDENGKASHVELNGAYAQIWKDLATLILEGIPWRQIEPEMYQRFGYTNSLGEQFQHNYFHRIIYTPSFWGNNARHYKGKGQGAWIYQEGEPVPDGVEMYYDSWRAVYEGELAEKIKAELHRRTMMRGNAKPADTKRFTGIFICGECSYNLSYSKSKGWVGWRCMTRYEKSATRPDCNQHKSLSGKKAEAYIDTRLREMVAQNDPVAFFPTTPINPNIDKELIMRLEDEIKKLKTQILNVIRDKASSEDNIIRGLYDDEIKGSSEKLSKLKSRLEDEKQRAARHKPSVQYRAYQEIMDLSVDEFWNQRSTKINQLLHRLMGDKRFVVLEGEIVGIADAPKRKRRFEG